MKCPICGAEMQLEITRSAYGDDGAAFICPKCHHQE